jgi:hypothetical protein
MLRIAGGEADIVSISPLVPGATGFDAFVGDVSTSDARIEAQLAWIKQGAGSRFDEIELSVMAHQVAVTSDSDGTVFDLAGRTGATPTQIASSPHMLVGSAEEITETLLDRRERYGISYVVFAARDLDAIQPVVARLVGT